MVAGMRHTLQVHIPPGWRALAALVCLVLAGCADDKALDGAYRSVAQGEAERGRLLLARYQCGSCHAIPGAVGPSLHGGPTLDGFGRRSFIAGRIPNAPANLQRWLQAPQDLVPETTMPDLGVTAEDARDITAYLMSLS